MVGEEKRKVTNNHLLVTFLLARKNDMVGEEKRKVTNNHLLVTFFMELPSSKNEKSLSSVYISRYRKHEVPSMICTPKVGHRLKVNEKE